LVKVNSGLLQNSKAALGASDKKAMSSSQMDDLITDKEIQEILKDPKYAELAKNPEMVKSLTESLKQDPALNHKSKPKPSAAINHHYMSPAYKAHLERQKNWGEILIQR